METLLDLQELAWRLLHAESVEERRELDELLRMTSTEVDSSEDEFSANRQKLENYGVPFHYIKDVFEMNLFYKILEAKDRIDTASINNYIPWRKHQ